MVDKKIVWVKIYPLDEFYAHKAQNSDWLRGVAEFITKPSQGWWSITIEFIRKDENTDFYWGKVFFNVYETAPQELLFVGQELYLLDGAKQAFHLFIEDEPF